MKNTKTLQERLDDLKAAHPDMIWRYGSRNLYDKDWTPVEGYFVEVICPSDYSIWPTTNRLTLTGKYDILSGTYTVRGAKRKVSELECMEWDKLDEIARKARGQERELSAELDRFFDAANKPLTDEQYRNLTMSVAAELKA